MSDTNLIVEAISLSENRETVLLPLPELKTILEEMGKQREEIEKLQENFGIAMGLIARLKAKIEPEPSPAQANRGETLRAILAASGGKMLAKDARKRLSMDKSSFSRLLSTMNQEITVKKFHANKRQNVIILNG